MTIARFIRDDLAAHIARGKNVPEQWTLAALASRYSVSITPVRAALAELVQQGWLVRSNGRLQVNPDRLGSDPAQPPTVAPASPTDWYTELSYRVLRISLSGEARFLREEAMGAELGVSRTVIRQVFGRMVGAGLLEHIPRRGWRVVPYREADMLAYLQVREVLEVKALELAWPNLEKSVIQAMLAGNRGGGPALDNRLHEYFIEKSANRYIREFFRTFGGYYTALFDYAALGADVVTEMAGEHRAILEAILANRLPDAQMALAKHIRSQPPVMQKMVERLQAEGPD